MPANAPSSLKSGEAAHLIPVVAESSREKRLASTFLAALAAIPDLAGGLLSSIGQRVGSRSRLDAYTEVVFADQPKAVKDRPDGLLVLRTGRKEWSALVETKIGRNELTAEQVERYAELAKANGINAVITVSNQFVARPDHHPVKLPRSLTKKVEVYHWSWMFILTQAYLLDMEEGIENADQAYLLKEVLRFLSHDSSGIDSFDRMNKEWKDVVRAVQSGGVLKKGAEDVEQTVASWHQETRDLCLIMSRHLGRNVKLKLPRQHQHSPNDRLKDDCRHLAENKELTCVLQIPDAAADMEVTANLQTRTLSCSMRLQAPEDRKQTKARVNWLLRQLAKTKDPGIHIRAIWPTKASDTLAPLAEVREDPAVLQTGNPKLAPRALDVVMVKDLAGKFAGSKTFIEHVEANVTLFYDDVGQYLRIWQPAPPKPRKPRSQPEVDEEGGGAEPAEVEVGGGAIGDGGHVHLGSGE